MRYYLRYIIPASLLTIVIVITVISSKSCNFDEGANLNLLKNLPADMKSVEESRTEEEELLFQTAVSGKLDTNIGFMDFDGDGKNEAFIVKWNDSVAQIQVYGIDAKKQPQMIYAATIDVYSEVRQALYLCSNGDGTYSILIDKSEKSKDWLEYQHIGIQKQDGAYQKNVYSKAAGPKKDHETEFQVMQQLEETGILIVESNPANQLE